MACPRISHNPAVMGGNPRSRRLRITVGTVVGLIASGSRRQRMPEAYPHRDQPTSMRAWLTPSGRSKSDRRRCP